MKRKKPSDRNGVELIPARVLSLPQEQRTRYTRLGELLELRREPLAEQLGVWLAAAPSVEDVQAYAAKSPDRWAQGVAILSRASGYSERNEVKLTGLAQIEKMSDSELAAVVRRQAEASLDELASTSPALAAQLAALSPAERHAAITALAGTAAPHERNGNDHHRGG